MERAEQTKTGWNFRMAQPSDAEAFSRFVAENPQIDAQDVAAASKDKNPTVVYFVVEKDGVAVAFAPLYCSMTLAHLGLNPDARADDKMQALKMLIDGVSAFAVQYGVREITTLSKEEYPIARWAKRHGFDVDSRQLLRLDLNKILEQAEIPAEV